MAFYLSLLQQQFKQIKVGATLNADQLRLIDRLTDLNDRE